MITIEQLKHQVPSAFSEVASVDRSSKYEVISTPTIIDTLTSQGFIIDKAIQAKTRKEIWQGYQKHQLFFDVPGYDNPDHKIQLRVVNSYNGGSSLQLYLGVYVFVCSNGLVRSNGEEEQLRVSHIGNAAKKFQERIDQVLGRIPGLQVAIRNMTQKSITPFDQLAFAHYAVGLKWSINDIPFNPADLLTCRHGEQREATLWNTYNRIQENMIKGFQYRQGRKLRKIRQVNGIDADININKKLWEYAEALV